MVFTISEQRLKIKIIIWDTDISGIKEKQICEEDFDGDVTLDKENSLQRPRREGTVYHY